MSDTGIKVYDLLRGAGLNDVLAGFATAQSAHETAGWISSIYKSNNNCFGMKYAGQAAAMNEKNGYANYASVQLSCVDFVIWYSKHRKEITSLPLVIHDLPDYVHFLKNRKYFEADEQEYLKGCTYFYNKLFPNG